MGNKAADLVKLAEDITSMKATLEYKKKNHSPKRERKLYARQINQKITEYNKAVKFYALKYV